MEKKKILFNITNQCNLKCWHCYNDSSPQNCKPDLSKLIAIAERIVELQPSHISISGGEPLSFGKQIQSITSILRKSNAKLVLITNGTLINEKTIQMILDNFDCVQVSIDKPNDIEYSTRMKGNPLYGNLLYKSIEVLSHSQIPIIYSHVPNKYNFVLSSYFEDLYIPNLTGLITQFAVPFGRAIENQSYDLLVDQRKAYINQLEIIRNKYSIQVKLYLPSSFDSETITIDYNGNVYNTSFSGGSKRTPLNSVL